MKKALLIGINYFGVNQLEGCVNDAKDVGEFLSGMGYECKYLLDKDATREAIFSCIEDLVKDNKDGDKLFFHYSGHGASTVDRSGDEIDGKDETIVPYSGEWIIDDELRIVLVDKVNAGVSLFAIADCCHSGTVFDLRYICKINGDKRFKHQKCDLWIDTNYKRTDGKVVLLSGCKDSETSADASFNGRARGALTYAFLKVVKTDNFILEDMIKSVNTVIRFYPQNPQLSMGRATRLKDKINL